MKCEERKQNELSYYKLYSCCGKMFWRKALFENRKILQQQKQKLLKINKNSWPKMMTVLIEDVFGRN